MRLELLFILFSILYYFISIKFEKFVGGGEQVVLVP